MQSERKVADKATFVTLDGQLISASTNQH